MSRPFAKIIGQLPRQLAAVVCTQRWLRRPPALLLLWLIGVTSLVAAEVEVQIQPNPAWVGEVAQLHLVSNEAAPELDQLPNISALQWLGGPALGQNLRIVNGRRSAEYTATYHFRVSEAGTYTLPALAVRLKGRLARTVPQRFTVRERVITDANGQTVDMADLAFAEVLIEGKAPPPARLYVGQSVDVEVRVFILEQLYHELNYPSFELENVAFHDFTALYAGMRLEPNPKFKPPQIIRQQRNNMPFRLVTFGARLTPLAAGPLQGKIQIQSHLRIPSAPQQRHQPFRGGMFDDFFATRPRTVAHALSVALPRMTVEALPPAPAGTVDLNLVGQWRLNLELSPRELRVGESLTAALTIRGQGNIQALTPPQLNLPEFRRYDPEVKISSDGSDGEAAATVTWVFVPLSVAAVLPELRLSSFDPTTGQYQVHSFAPTIAVKAAPQDLSSGAAAVVAAPAASVPTHSKRPAHTATDILDIKTSLTRPVERPLWRNTAMPSAILLVLALLIGLGTGLGVWRRRRLAADPHLQRKGAAARQRARLFRALRVASAEQRPALIREQLVPLLTAYLDLPPGTTASALALYLDDEQPELAALLRQAECDGFAPGSGPSIDVQALLKCVQRVAIVLCGVLTMLPAWAAAADAGRQPLEPATAAYDQGDVGRAAAIYQELLEQQGQSAALLYNLGNCAYRQGELGRAAAFYEQALRLDPRDSNIVTNLNFVRARLGLKPRYQVRHPGDLIVRGRDLLRPDEWLLGIAMLALLWSIGTSLCTWRRRWRLQQCLHLSAALLLLAGVTAAATQLRGPYRQNSEAVIVDDRVYVHVLPNDDAGNAGFRLQEGDMVAVVGARAAWLRVRVDDAEGWVKRSAAVPVW